MSELGGRRRLSIEERAARRDELERRQGDRYSSLLHTLRAGREIDLGRRRGRRLEWHPIAGTLLRGAVVVLFGYLVVTTGVRYVREHSVDTWAGPDASVTSGQQLPGCAEISGYDATFPRWVRFEGKVFRGTGWIRPVGYTASDLYPETGYTLGELHLLRMTGTPDGLAGRTVLVKLASVPTGELFQLTECP